MKEILRLRGKILVYTCLKCGTVRKANRQQNGVSCIKCGSRNLWLIGTADKKGKPKIL